MIGNFDSLHHNIVQYFGLKLGQVCRWCIATMPSHGRNTAKPRYLVIRIAYSPAQAGISLAAIREFAADPCSASASPPVDRRGLPAGASCMPKQLMHRQGVAGASLNDVEKRLQGPANPLTYRASPLAGDRARAAAGLSRHHGGPTTEIMGVP